MLRCPYTPLKAMLSPMSSFGLEDLMLSMWHNLAHGHVLAYVSPKYVIMQALG